MKHLYFLLPFFVFILPCYCMEASSTGEPMYALPILDDLIPVLSYYSLDLATTSHLLRTCKTYTDKYRKGIPADEAQDIARNCDSITPEELNKIPFGISRLLLQNPVLCTKLAVYQQINALVHYAQEDNRIMFQHIINNESTLNRAVRKAILAFFQYFDENSLSNLDQNIAAYLGNKNNNAQLTDTDLLTSNIDVARILILNKKYESCAHKAGWVALHYLAEQELLEELIPLALSVTPNINRQTSKGKTALHIACRKDKHNICTRLIYLGADVNLKDAHSRTPLFYMVKYKSNIDIVKLLITNGADVNCDTKSLTSPLQSACTRREISFAELLLAHGALVDWKDSWDSTALHLAANRGRLKTVQLLLEKNADINSKDYLRMTPLHEAVRNGHTNVVELLIKNNADTSSKNKKGRPALYYATKHKHADIVQLLTENKTDIPATISTTTSTTISTTSTTISTTTNEQQTPLALEAIDTYENPKDSDSKKRCIIS